jgi:hypothetical protein
MKIFLKIILAGLLSILFLRLSAQLPCDSILKLKRVCSSLSELDLTEEETPVVLAENNSQYIVRKGKSGETLYTVDKPQLSPNDSVHPEIIGNLLLSLEYYSYIDIGWTLVRKIIYNEHGVPLCDRTRYHADVKVSQDRKFYAIGGGYYDPDFDTIYLYRTNSGLIKKILLSPLFRFIFSTDNKYLEIVHTSPGTDDQYCVIYKINGDSVCTIPTMKIFRDYITELFIIVDE